MFSSEAVFAVGTVWPTLVIVFPLPVGEPPVPLVGVLFPSRTALVASGALTHHGMLPVEGCSRRRRPGRRRAMCSGTGWAGVGATGWKALSPAGSPARGPIGRRRPRWAPGTAVPGCSAGSTGACAPRFQRCAARCGRAGGRNRGGRCRPRCCGRPAVWGSGCSPGAPGEVGRFGCAGLRVGRAAADHIVAAAAHGPRRARPAARAEEAGARGPSGGPAAAGGVRVTAARRGSAAVPLPAGSGRSGPRETAGARTTP